MNTLNTPKLLNPFARLTMKVLSPHQLISCEYQGWSQCYKLEYRTSRGARTAGLLSKDFRVGAMLVVDGKHFVVTEASVTITNEAPDETLIRVNAVDFASVLARATGSPTAVAGPRKSVLAPVIQGDFNPRNRRILT